MFDEIKQLSDRGIASPSHPYHAPGTLGVIPPHTPGLFELPAPALFAPEFARTERPAPGAADLAIVQLGWGLGEDAGPAKSAAREEEFRAHPSLVTVVFGAQGVELVGGGGPPQRIFERPVLDLAPFDRMNHGTDKATDPPNQKATGDRDLDFLVLEPADGGTALVLLENVEGKRSARPEPLARLPKISGPGSLLPVDYDREHAHGAAPAAQRRRRGQRWVHRCDGRGGLPRGQLEGAERGHGP